MIKTLNDMKLTTIPLFPNRILGKDTAHAKAMELTGISDHVKLPDIAISQMRHTMIPIKSVTENKTQRITFIVLPVSHFDTARSVMFNFSANCACVSFSLYGIWQ